MKREFILVVILLGIEFVSIEGSNDNNENRKTAFLDSEARYHVAWEFEETESQVTFEVSVKTKGFVGFGISWNGGMKGADMVIGGVNPDGSVYFSDRHGIGNTKPVIDLHQDWKLLEAYETFTHTVLKFSRLLETCDDQDVPITRDSQWFIWSFGQTDEIRYHMANRGSFIVNILDPPVIIPETAQWERLDLVVPVTMPPKRTTYWCTLFKSPEFQERRQAIGFGAVLKSPLAKKHSHHMSLKLCKAPEGVQSVDKFFSYFMKAGGEDCFGNYTERDLPIYQFCSETLLYSWAMGANDMFLPEDVGLTFTEGGESVYFFLEVHLNNPGAFGNISFETGTVVYHTASLRPIEGEILSVESPADDYSLIIPPNSTEFVVSSHCASSCTSLLGSEGITVFNVQLHAHRSAIKMRLRHFRDSIELPWISSDEMFDHSFQNNRNIKPVRILPGDQLILECTYSTNWSPNYAVYGGYSTNDEMCDATMYYFPKSPIRTCGSRSTSFQAYLGIGDFSRQYTSVKFNRGSEDEKRRMENYIRGYLNTKVEWSSPELRKEIQQKKRFDPQEIFCVMREPEITENEYKEAIGKEEAVEFVSYPVANEFFPPGSNCSE